MITRFTPPKVSPGNWENPRCSVKKDWYIHYRLYYNNGSKQVILKGMNRFKTWDDRYKCTKEILEGELRKLSLSVEQPASPIVHTDLRQLLTLMVDTKRKSCCKRHCDNLQTMVDRFLDTSVKMGSKLTVSNITRQQCLLILDRIYTEYKTFSDNTYNRYIKDLGTLFGDLMYYEYTDRNPFYKMRKKETVKQLKRIATKEEFAIIDEFLRKKHYHFWRFTRIFFSSGGREAELCRMTMSDILLKHREYKVTILKGRGQRQEIKAILPESYKFWKEVAEEGKDKKHPFGSSFAPDDKPLQPEVVSRTWKKLVKDELGMGDIDFYSLKHLHTDLIAARFGLETAQVHDDHHDSSTTGIYAVGEKKRQLEKLKQLDIGFI